MHTVNDPTNQQVEPKNIIICGAGPFGLATAIEAIKSGHKVTIIESRNKDESTLRPQLVKLSGTTKKFLKENIKKGDPLLDLISKGGHIQIKDIQRALIRKLAEEKLCTFMYSTKVSEVNMEEGTIFIQKQGESKNQDNTKFEPISFDHLVDATGTRHAIASFLKGSNEITYEATPSRVEQNHLIGYFKLHNRLNSKFPINKEITQVNFPNGFLCFIYPDLGSYDKSGTSYIKVNVVARVAGNNINGNHKLEIKNPEKSKNSQRRRN